MNEQLLHNTYFLFASVISFITFFGQPFARNKQLPVYKFLLSDRRDKDYPGVGTPAQYRKQFVSCSFTIKSFRNKSYKYNMINKNK